MPTTQDAIMEHRAAHLSRCEAIRADRRLSDPGRRRALAAEYRDGKATHDRLMADYRQQKADELEGRRRRAYSPPNADQVGFRAALRDADRVADAEEALRQLRRADATGDEVVAKALAVSARERGWGGVVDAYAQRRPAAAQAFTDLDDVEGERSVADRLSERLALTGPPLPPELRNLGDQAIANLADGG